MFLKLLLLAKVRNRLAPIIERAAYSTSYVITWSAASGSSSTSIISIRHSFLASLSSISFNGSSKLAILWHARSLAKYSIYHLDWSTSTIQKASSKSLNRKGIYITYRVFTNLWRVAAFWSRCLSCILGLRLVQNSSCSDPHVFDPFRSQVIRLQSSLFVSFSRGY